VCTPFDRTGSLVALRTQAKEFSLGTEISSLSAGELEVIGAPVTLERKAITTPSLRVLAGARWALPR
jgi:hypothetical protein